MQVENCTTEGDIDSRVPQRQQHKHLKAAHDIGSILTTKRNRKPIDKIYQDSNASDAGDGNRRSSFRGRGLRPTTSRKFNRIFGKNNGSDYSDSNLSAEISQAEEIFENMHKKLKKGESFQDSETQMPIVPLEVRRQELDPRNFTLNPIFNPFIRDYADRKADIKRFTNGWALNKNDFSNSGPLKGIFGQLKFQQNSSGAKNVKLLSENLAVRDRISGDAVNAQDQDDKEESNDENEQDSQKQSAGEEGQPKRKRGRPKGSKKQYNFDPGFSTGISNVAEFLDLARLPRELKKLMNTSDLRKLAFKDSRKDRFEMNTRDFDSIQAQESQNDEEITPGQEKSPSEEKAISNEVLESNKAEEPSAKDKDSKENIPVYPVGADLLKSLLDQQFTAVKMEVLTTGLDKILPQELHGAFRKLLGEQDDCVDVEESTNHTKMVDESESKSAEEPSVTSIKSLEGKLFKRAKDGKGENLITTNKNRHLLIPEGRMNSALEIANKKGKKRKIEEQKDLVQSKPLDVQRLTAITDAISKFNEEQKNSKTYINCDVRYFNFDFLVDKLGYFDVILVDPPWRIRGGQQNDSSFMFSNSKFSLEYETLSNQEIMNLRVDKLSQKGFIFLWILSNQLNAAYEILHRWGYEVIDQIIWVKMKDSKIYLSHGYYFMHSFEMCLVGYKCPPGEHVEYNSKISNNIIFGEVRKKSQKPDELYEIIELLMPGSKKIEIFARNHNLRPGWFSLGNQLGDLYDKWLLQVECNECSEPIKIGVKRYKAKRKANYDICSKCIDAKGLNPDDFFEMKNDVDEDVLHQYHSCNRCNSEPIWGTRFTCKECENYDLCEACYDLNLQAGETERFHDIYHEFDIYEIPVLADGLPAHPDKKCYACFQKPIVGTCFSCLECPSLHFCQNCFFTKPIETMKKFRSHQSYHQFEILVDPNNDHVDDYKCQWCEIIPIEGPAYKCDHCFEMYFCEKCYLKRESYKPNIATSHKVYHNFTRINAS